MCQISKRRNNTPKPLTSECKMGCSRVNAFVYIVSEEIGGMIFRISTLDGNNALSIFIANSCIASLQVQGVKQKIGRIFVLSNDDILCSSQHDCWAIRGRCEVENDSFPVSAILEPTGGRGCGQDIVSASQICLTVDAKIVAISNSD